MKLSSVGIILALFMALLFCTVTAWGADGDAIVVLDAGHGGEDGGAVASDGTVESTINLQITKKLEALFQFIGCETLLTRPNEDAVYSGDAVTLREKKVSDLKNRAALINEQDNAFVISIHQNSLPGHPKVQGAQVFYNEIPPAERAGQAVQAAINHALHPESERTTKAIDNSIYLMRESQKPAILVECGFMSSPEECQRLKDPNYQMRVALSILSGYREFCTSEDRSNG